MAKTKKHTFDYDLIVIGSGAGGSGAATIAASEGHRVAVIEADTFGGDSPNYSDIPLKALLHAAQLYDEARHGSRFGLRSGTLGYNFPALQQWKALAVKRTGAGGNRRYYQNKGIDTFQGIAHFLSPHEITVNRRHLSAKNFLVATGAQWTKPSIQGLETVKYLTPRTALELLRPPKSLFIVGGGQTGVEMAQLFATFGTKVYIGEVASRLLPKLDAEVGELIEASFHEHKGVTILTQSRIVAVHKNGLGKRVTYSRGGVEKEVQVDDVLIATGRMPQVDLGLENAGVAYTPKGIETNEQLQTSIKHIFAAGDVLGGDSSTHTALLQSRVAAHNMFHKNHITPNYTATPHIIFTNPGIAYVGLSEDDCTKRDLDVRIGTAPLAMTARSNTSDFREGFIKIIADKKGVLLGATVVAPHAGEIIHELVLALRHSLSVQQIADTPHAFLSWSEAIRIAANRAA